MRSSDSGSSLCIMSRTYAVLLMCPVIGMSPNRPASTRIHRIVARPSRHDSCRRSFDACVMPLSNTKTSTRASAASDSSMEATVTASGMQYDSSAATTTLTDCLES